VDKKKKKKKGKEQKKKKHFEKIELGGKKKKNLGGNVWDWGKLGFPFVKKHLEKKKNGKTGGKEKMVC